MDPASQLSTEQGGVAQQGTITRESHFSAVLADCRQAKRPKKTVEGFDGSPAYKRDSSSRTLQQLLQSAAAAPVGPRHPWALRQSPAAYRRHRAKEPCVGDQFGQEVEDRRISSESSVFICVGLSQLNSHIRDDPARSSPVVNGVAEPSVPQAEQERLEKAELEEKVTKKWPDGSR